MNKGDYGYMNHYKKKHMFGVLIFAVLIITIVIAARMISDKTISAACYVLAVLFVLPGAKQLIAVLVVLPFHTLDEQSVEDLDEHTKQLNNGIAVYDVTLSSEQTIIYSPYLYLYEDQLFCLYLNTSGKTNPNYFQDYLSRILKNSGFMPQITMVRNISEMNRILENLVDTEGDYIDNLNNMKKQILIYSV